MSRYKIRLETYHDAAKLASIAESLDIPITLTDGLSMRVNAKSIMGALYSMEFNAIWIESENEIPYHLFAEFIV